MSETKNLERILSELEYLNTSILSKFDSLEKDGVIKELEKLLQKIKNAENTLNKLEKLDLIVKVIFYAILVDKNLVKNVVEIASEFEDDEVIEFLQKRSY